MTRNETLNAIRKLLLVRNCDVAKCESCKRLIDQVVKVMRVES